MKKILTFLLIISTVLCFAGCGKSKATANGCYQDINGAKSAAQKNNQDILAVITMAGDDVSSTEFIEKVINSDAFAKEVSSKYSVVHMDFSQASYEKTVVNPEADKNAQKAAEDYANIMQENAKYASLMNIQNTPALMLLTKEVYVIADLEYTDDVKSAADILGLIKAKQAKIDDIHAKVEATKKGTNTEKVKAIDALYEATDPLYQPFLKELITEVVNLDKNNESGVLSKYLLAKADSDAADFYLLGDAESAANAYIKACENKYFLPEHKQQSYYLAAYLLSMSGSTDFDKILGYLQKSLDADPESEQVPSIQNVIKYFKETLSSMEGLNSTSGEL